jgi:hypothetical protein
VERVGVASKERMDRNSCLLMVYSPKIIGSNPAVVNNKFKELQTWLEQEELVIPKYQRMYAKKIQQYGINTFSCNIKDH